MKNLKTESDKVKVSLITTQDYYISLGLGYLVSYYRKYGKYQDRVDFKAIECMRLFERIVESEESVVNRIKDSDIACFSTITQDYPFILNVARRVKERYKIPIVFGGHHISALPYTLPYFVDIAVLSEGDKTFSELLDEYIENKVFDKNWLKDIRGISYHDKDKIQINEKRDFIDPLDIIPPPARDIFNKNYWSSQIKLGRVSTSRGCPFKCIFCSSSRFWDNSIRYFSAGYIVNEIKLLMDKYNCNTIQFDDDLFTINIKRLKDIVNLLEKDDILGKINFSFVQARPDVFNDEICHLLKKMRVKIVGFGIESGSEKILRYLKGRNVRKDQNWDAVNRALRWGFSVWPQLIVGCPHETKEDIEKTLEFTRLKEAPSYQISMLTPYPGTDLWNYAIKRNLVSENMDFGRLPLDIKERELKKRVFLGEILTRNQLWQLIKEPIKKQERLRWIKRFSQIKFKLRSRSFKYLKCIKEYFKKFL